MMKQPKHVMAIDPGGAHVGVASWHGGDGIKATEIAAELWLPIFAAGIMHVDVAVIEKFVLYPSKAKSQAWSPMATSEMIGAMKWIAQRAHVPVVEQGADIKNPTRRQCKARHLKWKDNKSGHASDAILHLQHFLIRNELQDEEAL
jgi:hypothetical protein